MYLGWCAYRKGESVSNVFETVVEKSQTYKGKALITLAAIEARGGKYETELEYLTEAFKLSNSPTTSINISRAIAVIKAKEGFHKQALKDLEGLVPILKFADPPVYFDCLNSIAVELIEFGRIQEAGDVCRILLASPFINAYPEWRETGQDLALQGYKSRSSVRVIQSFPRNVVYFIYNQAQHTLLLFVKHARSV